ncbi:hypothetical protein SDC9_155528 [bioreactor metagenome]|uniref:Glycosyltransferase 2-like domain-containing protein n=1 Tax=bioreactor metagenome TaxID=1076179 RepID=A0A645F3N0_9ZZZZ
MAKYDINDCLIVLDSDDEYVPDAFEKLLRFMAEGDLEVAACTTDYIDGDDGSDLNRQVLENNLIISGLNFEAQFPEYFKFVRDSWGKMFSLSLFSHLEFQSFNHTIQHGSTSILSFEALCNSKRFGVLAQRLHKYYIYTHSLEQSGSTRISAPMLYKYYRDWVISKCGQLNDLNKRFLYGAYFRAIKNRTLPLIHSNIGLKEKLGLLRMVFDDILTTEMMSCDQIDGVSSENKAEYIGIVLSWVDSICFEEETEESLLCAYIRHRLEQM